MREEFEAALGPVEPERRSFLKKMAMGTAFAVPTVASFTMTGIDAVYAQTPSASGAGGQGTDVEGEGAERTTTTTTEPTTTTTEPTTTTTSTTTTTEPTTTTTSTTTTTTTTEPPPLFSTTTTNPNQDREFE